MRAFNGRLAGLVALAFAAVAGACTETIDDGAACSAAAALCPGQEVEIRDTIISPVLEWDSTFVGFPTRGNEFLLPLIAAGDTVKTNAIVRFDSLTTFYLPPLDTANLLITKLPPSERPGPWAGRLGSGSTSIRIAFGSTPAGTTALSV